MTLRLLYAPTEREPSISLDQDAFLAEREPLAVDGLALEEIDPEN